jgi:hypothetical protein
VNGVKNLTAYVSIVGMYSSARLHLLSEIEGWIPVLLSCSQLGNASPERKDFSSPTWRLK